MAVFVWTSRALNSRTRRFLAWAVFEFENLDGPLVIGIDGRDAGGIGGIMASAQVNGINNRPGREYNSGSAWRCWYTETQDELSTHNMQVGRCWCMSLYVV